MLIPAATQETQRASSNDLRMRSLQQKLRTSFNVNLLRDGQGIHSLRATGGAPADDPLARLGPEALQQRAEERRQQQNSLFELPAGGRGLVRQLSGQVRAAVPFMGGLVSEVIEGTGGVLQGRQVHMRQTDSRARLLVAARSELRGKGGFSLERFGSTFDSLG